MASAGGERRSYSSPAIRARRERILSVTRALIAERGSLNFNLGEVGTRAGVAKQTVYNIFGSKERIIATAVTEYFEERERQIQYSSRPATLDRMIERQVVAGRASRSMPHYLTALMSIYFAVDVDPDIASAIHNVTTYPHRAWIESMAERGVLEEWVNPSDLIDQLAAHTSLTLLDWCRGRLDLEDSLRRRVVGSLVAVAGSTVGPERQAIEARLQQIVRDGLPEYPEALSSLAEMSNDAPSAPELRKAS